MQSCNHEEADTRILVHVKEALDKGARSVLVQARSKAEITEGAEQNWPSQSPFPPPPIKIQTLAHRS